MQDDGVSVWIACLRDLKRLLSSSSSSSSSSIRGPDNSTSNQVLVERILTNTDLVGPDALPVSVAAHARLVNDLKLPLHLCAACITAADFQGAPEDKTYATIAACRTLASYLHYFTASKYDAITAAAGAAHAEDLDPLKTVAAAVRSQMEQSGLLQHLPALLADAAAALAVQTAQMAAAADVCGLQQSRTPPKISARTGNIAEQSVTAKTFVSIFSLWPYGLPMLKAAAASGPAALDLTMVTMQFVSSLVQQQQQLPVDYGAVCQELMKGVRHMTMDLIQGGVLANGLSTCVQELPELQQVLSSAQYLPCIVLCMVLLAYGSIARQQEHLAVPTGSSSSSRRRAQANQALLRNELLLLQDREEYVLAWDLGLRLQQGLTKSELRLFELLGVDATTMMWAAAAVRQYCQPPHLLSLLRAYYDRAASWEQSLTAGVKGCSAQQQQQQQQVVVVTPAEADSHLLLPCVLLHAVAHLPETDPGFAACCMYAGGISKAAACTWAGLQESKQPGLQESKYEAMVGVQLRFTRPGLMDQMPPEVVADVLPFLLDILRALLQQLQVPSDAAASSSSLMTLVHGGINPKEKEQRSALGSLTSFLCYLLLQSIKQQQQQQQQSTMAAEGSSKADRSQPASSSSSSCSAAAAAAEQVLRPHLAQALRCMEGFVRVIAAAPAWLNQKDPESFLAVAAVATVLNKSFSSFVQLVCKAGFGSVELLQLYSLLSSSVKACAVFGSVNPTATINVLFAAVNAAAEALTCYSSTGITAGKSTKSKTRQASVKALGAGAADAASMLPSLVTIGRCCLLFAQDMQQRPPPIVAREFRGHELIMRAAAQEMMGLPNLRLPIMSGPEACRDWLQRDDVSAQLSASGYDCEVLRQRVTECLEAFQKVEQADVDDPAAAGAAVTAMLPKLHDVGLAFAVLAIPEACNNRNCGNLRGLKEKSIVSGKGCLCSGCKVAHYCCEDCSTQHWKDHKPVCLALKAAAKSAGKQQRGRKGEVAG